MNRKKRMSRKKLTLASLVAIPAVAGLAFAVTGSAFAGTNGQQIQLCQPTTGYRLAVITGQNQDDVQQKTEKAMSVDDGAGCAKVENFWWKGQVTIEWQSSAIFGISHTTSICTVPVDYPEDTFSCLSPQNRNPFADRPQ